jgi:hypothetical protein
MAKKVLGVVKLQMPAGQATPAPPVGPALGQYGINLAGFCKEFNAATRGSEGLIVPAVVTVYKDRSFTFILKSPPAAVLLKRAAGLPRVQPRKGGKRYPCAVRRDCEAQEQRLERRNRGDCRIHDRGHRPEHGAGGGRLTWQK